MTKSHPHDPAVDVEALDAALRALGMFYGASQPLAKTVEGAKTEAEAIRMYIERERPHLLSSYDLDTLVKMVQGAREAKTDAKASVEQYSPGHEPRAKGR
ncbi:MAG TPA: hypothetical protein VE034_10755 [Burkholderiales bacterium]|nr:hypothetical protein [Burkholderiales bacterium]